MDSRNVAFSYPVWREDHKLQQQSCPYLEQRDMMVVRRLPMFFAETALGDSAISNFKDRYQVDEGARKICACHRNTNT